MKWADKPIFVTGATGFIGGRVCERLAQAGARRVRGLVHTIQHAPRIARLPITLCPGSLVDRESLRRGLADSKIVIHCGLGVGHGIARGTENLLEAAESAGVERFIHMSTAAVYGLTPKPGCEAEQAPLRRTGDIYCDNKIRAERIVSRFCRRGLPAVILRPSIVYGPYSLWSTRLVEALREGKAALIDRGQGACNTTYVDNLVDAIFLSLQSDRAVGQAFFITDGERVTWGDFIRAHAVMMERKEELPEISREEILAYYQQQPGFWTTSFKEARKMVLSAEFRRMLVRIPVCERVLALVWRSLRSIDEGRKERLQARLGSRNAFQIVRNGSYFPDRLTLATQTSSVFFRIDKARQFLGYEPRVPFSQGIKLVEQWLRFASYI